MATTDDSTNAANDTVARWAQDGATEQEQLEFLEQAIKDLGEDGNQEIFKAAMKELGTRGVLTDEAFSRVKNTLDGFVTGHGSDFPGIIPFQTEWNGYVANWKDYITTSRDFAQKTSSEYDDYKLLLEAVGDIKTKEEMTLLAGDFKAYSTNKPTGIPIDFKDKFLDLKNKVADFQTRFNKYLADQNAELTAEADQLKKDIDALKLVIEGLDKQVNDATLGLKIASIFGLIGAAIAGTALGILKSKRNGKQKELDDKKADLKAVEAKQTALAEIKAQFDGLIPDFELLAENLGLFADTWNAFHNEALDFATKFEKVETPSALPSLYKGRINLALAAAAPLSQGLKDYASTIHF